MLIALRALMQQMNAQQCLDVDTDTLARQLSTSRAEDASPSAAVSHPFIQLEQQLLAKVAALEGSVHRLEPVLYHPPSAGDALLYKAPNTPLDCANDGFHGMLASFCTVEDPRRSAASQDTCSTSYTSPSQTRNYACCTNRPSSVWWAARW